jgi:hypothetical protein
MSKYYKVKESIQKENYFLIKDAVLELLDEPQGEFMAVIPWVTRCGIPRDLRNVRWK